MSALPTSDVRLLVPQAGGPLVDRLRGRHGDRRARAADRLRQRRRHAAGARLRAHARDQRSPRHRRQPRRRSSARCSARAWCSGLCGAAVAVGAGVGADPRAAVDRACRFPARSRSTCASMPACSASRCWSPCVAGAARRADAGAEGVVDAAGGGSARATRRRRASAGCRWALRDVLVVAQLALTAVLLVVAGLLLRTLGASQSADVGFRMDGRRRAVGRHRHGALLTGARGAVLGAGARACARASRRRRPRHWRHRGCPSTSTSVRRPFMIEGKPTTPDDRGEIVSNVAVSPDYFRDAGHPDRRRARVRRRRSAGRAARRRHQRDHGAPLLARRERGRPTFQLTSDSARTKFQVVGVTRDHRAAHCCRAAVAVSPLRRRAAARALQLRRGPHARAMRRNCSSAMRRELLAIEPGPRLHQQFDDGSRGGDVAAAAARRRRAGRRLRRRRHAARRHRAVRRHRVLGGAAHARDWRPRGHWRRPRGDVLALDHASGPGAGRRSVPVGRYSRWPPLAANALAAARSTALARSTRSPGLRRSASARRRARRQLSSRPAGDAGRSRHGAPGGIGSGLVTDSARASLTRQWLVRAPTSDSTCTRIPLAAISPRP